MKRALSVLGLTVVACVSMAQGAFAAAQDYSSLTSGFSAELTAAVPVALAAVGLFVGVILAYKVVRRILRA